MRDKLTRFMSGRYGIDQLYRALLLGAVISLLLATLLSDFPVLAGLFNAISYLLIIWATYRIFSRKIEKRYLENLHYLEYMGSVRQRLRMSKEKFQQRKEYKFFVCPTCKTNLRVPKGKGKVHITCCKCGNRFQGKT